MPTPSARQSVLPLSSLSTAFAGVLSFAAYSCLGVEYLLPLRVALGVSSSVMLRVPMKTSFGELRIVRWRAAPRRLSLEHILRILQGLSARFGILPGAYRCWHWSSHSVPRTCNVRHTDPAISGLSPLFLAKNRESPGTCPRRKALVCQ